MRIKPGTPPDEVNLPSSHPLVEVSHLLIGGVVVLLALTFVVGLVMDQAADWISPETEREVFEPLTPMLLAEVGVDTEASAEGLQVLLDRAAEAAPAVGLPLKAHLSCSSVPNAMALPGGHIVVTSGLLDLLKHENSLLFVLGHEIGHLVHRDHLKGMGRGLALGLLLPGLFALGGGGGGEELALEAAQAVLRSHDREQELRSDEVGAEVVSRIYGHLGGVEEVHDVLSAAVDESWADRLDWKRTHPVGPHRKHRIADLAEERSWKTSGPLVPLSSQLSTACGEPLAP